MSFAAVERQIAVIADLFMGAAYADWRLDEKERLYIRKMLEDLLSVPTLPTELSSHIDGFDPERFDMLTTAHRLRDNPPMRLRRLLELVGYVMLADGEMCVAEDRYMRRLGEAFGLDEDDYRDLTRAHESQGARRTFTRLAVVPVPAHQVKRRATGAGD